MYKALKKNALPIVIYEIIYKLSFVLIVLPIYKLLLGLVLLLAGVKYVAADTLPKLLTSIPTYPIALFVIFSLAYLVFSEMCALIVACDSSLKDKKISLSEMFGVGFYKGAKIFVPKNYLLILIILVIVPLSSVVQLSSLVKSIEIPGFINDYINGNLALATLCVVAIVVFAVYSILLIPAVYYFVFSKDSFIKSIKNGFNILKKKKFRFFIYVVLVSIILMLATYAVATIIAIGEYLFVYYLSSNKGNDEIAFENAIALAKIIITALGVLVTPLTYFFISKKINKYKNEKGEEEFSLLKKMPSFKGFLIIILVIVLFFTGFNTLSKQTQTTLFSEVYSFDKTQVVAHRGYSEVAPENNIPAFKAAIEKGCRAVELDVHQTVDGVVVVTHDDNIKRIAGVDKFVHELTYEELESYDVGSWFSEEYKDLKVATLDEVIKLCKETETFIQIELKPTGNEKDFEENVIKVVRDNNYEEHVYLASLQANCVKRCKELANDIETLYIMVLASGDFKNIDYADAFSIEESNVTKEDVLECHAIGKPLYVWTINDESSVSDLVDMNVDGLLTDKVETIQSAIDQAYQETKLEKYIKSELVKAK